MVTQRQKKDPASPQALQSQQASLGEDCSRAPFKSAFGNDQGIFFYVILEFGNEFVGQVGEESCACGGCACGGCGRVTATMPL